MLGKIVPQNGHDVKAECADEHCGEPIFRDGLCLDHLVIEGTAAWNDYTDEVAQAHLVSVGRG